MEQTMNVEGKEWNST